MSEATPSDPLADAEDEDELFLLFETSAKVLARSGDPSVFLDWIAKHGPSLAPRQARMIDPRTGPVGNAFRVMGVAIYNAMPLPDADFQARRLPAPGRNEPCVCGSGRKYKHCCLPLAGLLDLSQYNMLRHVLDTLPKNTFADLPASRVDAFAVCETARQWQEEGDAERAVALLEQLMDCYLALGKERKRARLLADALARGDRVLRTAALQRRATMLADKGDMDGAWESFLEAQREDPDNPNHGSLEVTLLVSRGETERARERARFWIARMERMRDPELADVIAFLRTVATDPHGAMAEIDRRRTPGLDRLAALFSGTRAAEPHYTAVDLGEAGRVLQPDQALGKIEARWREVFEQVKPGLTGTQHDFTGMWNDPRPWLDFLERNPLAWQSLDVIDDLAMAVEALQPIGADATLLEPLLARGVALLEANLNAAPSGNGTFQWDWMENRPALRMLAHLAYRAFGAMDSGGPCERAIALGERMLAFNPNDNHFAREPLTRAYLKSGRPQAAIALTDRYPDDFCGPTLNRVLALVRLDRRGEALASLRAAAKHHRVAIDMLLADNPKPPKPDGGAGITVGGKEEAWDYRAAHRALWERGGALDWLRAAWSEVRRTARG